MAKYSKAQEEELIEILEEILGPERTSLNFERIPPRQGKTYAQGRPLGQYGPRGIFIDPEIADLDDLRYIAAHEAGHAKHHKTAGTAGYNMASEARREYLADETAMKHHASKGRKLGPAAQQYAKQTHPAALRFAKQAGKFGLLPLLLLSLAPMLTGASSQKD